MDQCVVELMVDQCVVELMVDQCVVELMVDQCGLKLVDLLHTTGVDFSFLLAGSAHDLSVTARGSIVLAKEEGSVLAREGGSMSPSI